MRRTNPQPIWAEQTRKGPTEKAMRLRRGIIDLADPAAFLEVYESMQRTPH